MFLYYFQSMIQNVRVSLGKLQLYNFDKKDKLYRDIVQFMFLILNAVVVIGYC